MNREFTTLFHHRRNPTFILTFHIFTWIITNIRRAFKLSQHSYLVTVDQPVSQAVLPACSYSIVQRITVLMKFTSRWAHPTLTASFVPSFHRSTSERNWLVAAVPCCSMNPWRLAGYMFSYIGAAGLPIFEASSPFSKIRSEDWTELL